MIVAVGESHFQICAMPSAVLVCWLCKLFPSEPSGDVVPLSPCAESG